MYKYVNDKGVQMIAEFLAANHKRQKPFTHNMLLAWAADAETQLMLGNSPTIEVRSWDSLSGATITFTVPDEGISSEEFSEDESC